MKVHYALYGNYVDFYRFIFVNYNAWLFAGSDFLWAGIITALVEKVEEEFGIFTTRLFRSITLETVPQQCFCIMLLQYDTTAESSLENQLKNIKLQYMTYKNWEQKGGNLQIIPPESKDKCFVIEFRTCSAARAAEKKLKELVKVSISVIPQADFFEETDDEHDDNRTYGYRIKNALLTVGFIYLVITSVIFSILAFETNIFGVSYFICKKH